MLEPDTNRELAIKLQYVRQGLEKGQQQLHISQVPPLYEIFTPRRFYKIWEGYSSIFMSLALFCVRMI